MLSPVLLFILALTARVSHAERSGPKRPNIVFILSDDQDKRLGSTDFQSVLQREIFAKGVEFTNHYGTTAQCCPARASIFRGQFSHNTNITHVHGAGSVSIFSSLVLYFMGAMPSDFANSRTVAATMTSGWRLSRMKTICRSG